MMSGDELEAKIRAVVEKLIERAREGTGDVLPKRTVARFDPPAGYHSEDVPDASYAIVIEPGNVEARRALEEAGVSRPVDNMDVGMLFTLAARVCERERFRVDESKWSSFWPEMAQFLRNKSQNVVWWLPVMGMAVDGPYELDGGITLRPLTIEERERLINLRFMSQGHHAQAVFECTRPAAWDEVVNASDMLELFGALRVATWIVMGPRVHFGAIRRLPRLGSGEAEFGIPSPEWSRPLQPLSPVVGDEFARFWRLAQSAIVKPKKTVSAAMRRFRQMYEQPRIDDWVLDEFIILEKLLSPDDNRELSYRVGLRLAHLIGRTLESRREILSLVTAAYRERSRIAHGGTTEPKTDEMVWRLDVYVRQTLATFLVREAALSMGDVKEVICKELDEKILEQASAEPGQNLIA